MNELVIRGHRPADTYPAEAVDIDFSGPTLKSRPAAQLLFSSPTGSILGAYRDPSNGAYLLVCRNGTTDYLYHRQGTTNTLLAYWTEGVQDGMISFVPLQDRVVVVARSRIYLVDMSAPSATLVTKPSTPSGVTAAARQEYITMANYLASASDRATVSYSSPFFTVDDNTSDPIAGAYQELYANSQADVGHCDAVHLLVENYDAELQAPSYATPISASRTGSQRYVAGVPANCMVQGWVSMALTSSKLVGVEVFVQAGAVKVHERLYYTPSTRPTEYRITRVSNGFESDPLDVTVSVSSSDCPAPGGYVVDFSGLPSGTWRIYRRDALGDWRLVEEGTGSTYTDRKREEELGEKWYPADYPYSGGQGALLWQGRIVLYDGAGKVYVSEVGEYAWRDDSDILHLPSRLLGMAAIGGRLYLNHSGGWWELIGAPGAWLQRKVLDGNAPKPSLGVYISDSALAAEGRLYLPSPSGWVETNLNDSHTWCWGVYQGMVARGTQCTYIMIRGRWSRWLESSIALWYGNSRYELAKDDGVYALNGDPVSGYVREVLPLPTRANTVGIYIDGNNSVSVSLNGSTPESHSLPHLWERRRIEDWELDVKISVNHADVRRVLINIERSTSYG